MERIVNQYGMKGIETFGGDGYGGAAAGWSARRRRGGLGRLGAQARPPGREAGRGAASQPPAALRRRPPPASIPPGPQPPASRAHRARLCVPTRHATRAPHDAHCALRAPRRAPWCPPPHLIAANTTITVIVSVAGYNRVRLRNICDFVRIDRLCV